MTGIEQLLKQIEQYIWGWPMIVFVVGVGLYLAVQLRGIQFRAFGDAWRSLLSRTRLTGGVYISPFQALINTLSASIGNGSLAGMATAVAAGGPGAAFWIFMLGFIGMGIRFAEVFASGLFTTQRADGVLRGGPMVYLRQLRGGAALAYGYAFFCMLLAFVTGNGMQCNAIRMSIESAVGATDYSAYFIAAGIGLFVLYVMSGGAARIVRVSDAIVPVKVGVFFVATTIALIYHASALWPALKLIMYSGLTAQAFAGGVMGYSVQQAMRFGMARSINATEAGLGTSAILFGASPQGSAYHNAVMSLISIFITNYLVCFVLALLLVATGVWSSPLVAIDMTIAAYGTVFGGAAQWIVIFLAITFGLGCLITYGYIGQECWAYLFRGKGLRLYGVLYSAMAAFGSVAHVALIWNSIDIVNAGLLIINLYGLARLAPRMHDALKEHLCR